MRVLFSFIAIFFSVSVIVAQSKKVVAAWKYLQDYNNVKDTSSLQNAKEAIDIASENSDTKLLAKTWLYRGKIYQTLFEVMYQVAYDMTNKNSELNKRILEAYYNSDIEYLSIAKNAYTKATELDVKKSYEEDIAPHFSDCARHFENIAVANYNHKNYGNALIGFEAAMNLNSVNGNLDTVNMLNAKVAAEMLQDTSKTKELYEKMLSNNVGKASTYHNYQNFLLNKLKNKSKAFEIVKMGRMLYPSDVTLLNDETNFYLQSNNAMDVEKAIDNLKLAINQSPEDAILNLALGNLYDRLANPKSIETGKDIPKPANYDSLIKDAEKYYSVAYQLNKTDVVTLFNLGALYNNRASLLFTKASEITDDAKYKKTVKEAHEVLNLAKSYLEEAFRLNEKDCGVIMALKQMYLTSNDTDKFTAISKLAKTEDCK